MSLTTLLRAVSSQRRRRDHATAAPTVAITSPEPPRRRTAMGIDVSPVHGRHCICGRCAPHDAASN